MFNNKSMLVILFALSTITVNADITGTGYKDFNLNGSKEGGDVGVMGIPITAVCEDTKTYTATTDTNGAYTLTGFPAGNKCRVEADPSNAGVRSGSNVLGSAPLIDVVNDGETHNISTSVPSEYCQANPNLAMTMQVSGASASTTGSIFEMNSTIPGTLVSVLTLNKGHATPNASSGVGTTVLARDQQVIINTDTTRREKDATREDTGGIWGLAWSK
jgi:hypothetical protein